MDSKKLTKKNNGQFQPIKILKRQQNSDPCLVDTPACAAPNPRVKTLEEREAAYAEARLRILGPVSREENGPVSDGHFYNNFRNSGATKYTVGPDIKIVSNTVRQNNKNGKM